MSFNLPPFQLDVYSHGFKVSRFNHATRDVLANYARRYAQWGLVPTGRGRFERVMTKIFAVATRTRDEFFFHRSCLDEFLEHCRFNQIDLTQITRKDHPLYVPDTIALSWESPRVMRDYQVRAEDFFLKPLPIIKALTLQTGKGKSANLLHFLTLLQQRAVVVIKGMYIQQWKEDAVASLGLKPGELMIVQGSKSLKGLIDLFIQGDVATANKVKLVIISNSTYRNYMQAYKEYTTELPSVGYGCAPIDFFKVLRAGVRVIDEVHLFFHFNYTMDCMTHVPKSISLSATLKTGDAFIDKLYGMVFPEATRAPMPVYDRYIDVYVISYRFDNPTLIRYLNVMRQYNQAIFEKSILHYKVVLKNYVNMIVALAHTRFVVGREPGQKLAIFCGLVKMVEHVVASLQVRFPDLKVGRFIDVDPDSVLEESDIIVTTLQSCGTAKDIPGLKVVINTIGLNKLDTNQQLIGRLRRLQGWPDTTPEFIYLIDRGNPKHLTYAAELPKKLEGRIRHLNQLTSSFVI